MSDEQRQRKNAEHKRALAEMRNRQQTPLPPPPRLVERTRTPLEDVAEPRRRTTRYTAPNTTSSAAAHPTYDQPPPRPVTPIIPPAVQTRMDLQRVRALSRPAPPPLYAPAQPEPLGLLGELQARPWLLLLIALLSIVVIVLTRAPDGTNWSNFLNRSVVQLSATALPVRPLLETPDGQHTVLLQGEPQITAAIADRVLAEYGSPAAGTGQIWIDLGRQYGIEPAYALAFFIHESSAGTNPGWAGLKPGGATTHNIGNIICAGYATCYNRFRDYGSWSEGIEDWYKLISKEYIGGRAAQTVEQIIPIYAPAFENNVNAYVDAVVQMVEGWRRNGVP